MTYTSIRKKSLFSSAELSDRIYCAAGDAIITDEEFENIFSDIVSEVNKHLPGSLNWSPWTSDIFADIDDPTEFTDDDFEEILESAFWVAFEKNGF